MSDEILDSTRDKALHLNLDAAKYGTFAEIGAGQESLPIRRQRPWAPIRIPNASEICYFSLASDRGAPAAMSSQEILTTLKEG